MSASTRNDVHVLLGKLAGKDVLVAGKMTLLYGISIDALGDIDIAALA